MNTLACCRRATALGMAIGLALIAGCGAEAGTTPVNDLPNPYERIEPWAQLPDDLEAWPQVTAVEPGPDGNIYVFYRAEAPADPIVVFSPDGTPINKWGAGSP